MNKRLTYTQSCLVQDNLELAKVCGRNFFSRYLETDDRIQIALVALVSAALEYRPEIGAFGKYAWVIMRNAIFNEGRKAAADQRRLQSGAVPVENIISQYVLDKTWCSERLVSNRQILTICRQILDSTQFDVLVARLGLDSEPRTLHEIAGEMGVAHETVRRIEQRATQRVREYFAG